MLDTPAPFSQDRGHYCLQRNVFFNHEKDDTSFSCAWYSVSEAPIRMSIFFRPYHSQNERFFLFFFFVFFFVFFPSYVRSNVLTTSQIHGKLSIA